MKSESAGLTWIDGYFASGWALLLPYLVLYLIAAALRIRVDDLLFVFRCLHVLHAIGAGWWLLGRWQSLAGPTLAAWLLLSLVVYCAGTYIEFPSDPWEHLTRINAWAGGGTVIEHPQWRKSSYFFAFSLTGLVSPGDSLVRLDLYQTGMTVLWLLQIFRVASASGLGRGAAFISTVVMLLTAGNSAFAFHRYYGLSSTLVCQIGVLACTHACLTFCRKSWFPAVVEASAALGLIAFTHTQGFAIALLAGLAVVLGRWVGRSRARAASLGALLFAANAAVYLWYPRLASVDGLATAPAGWLSRWLGFNLLDPSSPAASQAFAILGVLGVLNVLAGIFLFLRGHIVGWLTVGPIAALFMPLCAVPLTDYLLRSADLAIFHRLIFAVPSGLAIVTCADFAWRRQLELGSPWHERAAPVVLAMAALALAVIPASRSGFNRMWHALAIAPADLSLQNVPARQVKRSAATRIIVPPGIDFIFATNLTRGLPDYALNWSSRLIVSKDVLPPARRWQLAMHALDATATHSRRSAVFVADPYALTTDFSIAARLSGHWFEQEVALEHVGLSEFRRAAIRAGFRPAVDGQGMLLERGSAAINTLPP